MIKSIASTLYQRVSLFTLAFVIAVSSLTAVVPFIFADNANAISSAVYGSAGLNGWNADRTYPTGGAGIATFAGREGLQLNVTGSAVSADSFYKYEGLQKTINPSMAVKADLYVDAGWPADVRAGFWAAGYNNTADLSAYPIVEYSTATSSWRIFDSAGAGGWKASNAVPVNAGAWNSVELTINKTDSTKTDVFINGVFAGASIGEPTTSLNQLFLNNYNAGTSNYAVRWSNIQTGNEPTNYPVVYVSPTGNDADNGVTAATAFKTIQKGLDTVSVNGTVNLAAGTFPQEKLTIVKNGTKLIGQGRDATKVTVLSNASGQGLLAEGLNDITIKSLGVIGSNDAANASGNALIKLANGQNGIIENVLVGSSSAVRTKATGIDINGYSNVRIDNVFIYGLDKDGIAVNAKTAGQSYNTDNIRIQGAAVADVAWSAIAFYTSKGSQAAGYTPTSNITNVSFGGTTTLQYNDQGIYFDGHAGNTITGVSGQFVKTDGVVLKDSRKNFIDNAQTAGVNAVNSSFDIGGNINRPAVSLTAAELVTVGAKIIDRTDNTANGVVYLQGPKTPTLSAVTTYVNGTENAKAISWTNGGESVAKFKYLQYNSLAEKNAGTVGYSETIDGSKYTTDVAGSWSSATFYYQIVAVDAAGNESAPSAFGTVIVDREAPTVVTEAQVYQTQQNGRIAATLTFSEAIKAGTLGQGWNGSGTTWTKVYYSTDTYAITFTDIAGNPGTYTLNIDKTAPTFTITGVTLAADKKTPTITGTITDTSAVAQPVVKVTINGAVYTATVNGSNWTATGVALSDNTYTATVAVTDKIGNPAAPKTVSFTVDTTAPAAPVITNSPITINNSKLNAQATWSHDDVDVDHYEYREYMSQAAADADVDGNTASYWVVNHAAGDKTQTVGSSWTGTQTLYYRIVAVDAAGNRSIPSALGTVNIDKVAPGVLVNPATVTGNTVTITGTVDDVDATLAATLNGVSYVVTNDNGAWSFTSPALANGTYEFSIVATDVALNPSTAATTPVVIAVAAAPAPAGTPEAPAAGANNGPASPAANAGVLGATTDDATAEAAADTDVEGVTDTAKNVAAADTKANGNILGLAWYWWLIILAAIAAIAWWIVGAVRNRNAAE